MSIKNTDSLNNFAGLNHNQLKALLEERADFYNQRSFIDSDPVLIPHQFSVKEDIEIAGFLSATIAWGNRKSIVNNGMRLVKLMDNRPLEFIMNFTDNDIKPFNSFVHRTFNSTDLITFMYALRNIYRVHGGMEKVFHEGTMQGGSLRQGIGYFREVFFGVPHLARTRKHVSNPLEGSAAKRINMFLRWMVRKDDKGVDFGIWKLFKPGELFCPLDVHSGRQARRLGLLTRKQNDWKAVEQLTMALKMLDPDDPVKYDFALFGLGVFER